MTNIYLYPNTAKSTNAAYNPYKDDLAEALSNHFNIVNKDLPTNKGVFDILKYLNKIDFLYLNWIENLPDKSLGLIQSIVFCLIFTYCKLSGKKIIWTMHNKFSHNNKGYRTKKILLKLLTKHSDFIITHASEGIRYAKDEFNRSKETVFYHHPIKNRIKEVDIEKSIDILIWGNLVPHKEVDKFLEYLYHQGQELKYEILIVGKIFMPEYEKTLRKFENKKIRIENSFLEFEELANLCSQSKVVLFTHHGLTVLSSGVLIDSLSFGARVIGPNVGAFSDLKEIGIVETFLDYNNLDLIFENELNNNSSLDFKTLIEFINNNSWNNTALNIANDIKTKFNLIGK